MEDKSYVGMSNCFFCNEAKEILLDRRLRNSLPRSAVYNHEPCDKCKGYMQQGIILISVNEKLTKDMQNPYRSGGWCVIKEEAIRRMLQPGDLLNDILKKRMAFVPDNAWDALGLPRAGKGD